MAIGFDDPITADFASRNEVEEEEEAACDLHLPDQYTVAPDIQIASPSPPVDKLLVIEGNSNSLMADALFPSASAAGAISVPELQRLPSPLDQELGKSQHAQHVTTLLQGPGSLLIAVMRRPVPPEQAVTWAQAVTAALSPKAVVAATSMLAKDYRGPGSPADEDMVFAVQTSAARPVNSVAPLPPGSVISGLAASLLEHCESAGLPATALVAVEHAPVPESGLVCRMAEAVSAVVGGVEAPGDSARRAIGNALNGAYQSSASNSMFS